MKTFKKKCICLIPAIEGTEVRWEGVRVVLILLTILTAAELSLTGIMIRGIIVVVAIRESCVNVSWWGHTSNCCTYNRHYSRKLWCWRYFQYLPVAVGRCASVGRNEEWTKLKIDQEIVLTPNNSSNCSWRCSCCFCDICICCGSCHGFKSCAAAGGGSCPGRKPASQ